MLDTDISDGEKVFGGGNKLNAQGKVQNERKKMKLFVKSMHRCLKDIPKPAKITMTEEEH